MKLKKMEPLPLKSAHPEVYIVDDRRRPPGRTPRLEGSGRPPPGGVPEVQISSASHGLFAVRSQFVLPLEAAQKGPFFQTPVSGMRIPL